MIARTPPRVTDPDARLAVRGGVGSWTVSCARVVVLLARASQNNGLVSVGAPRTVRLPRFGR